MAALAVGLAVAMKVGALPWPSRLAPRNKAGGQEVDDSGKHVPGKAVSHRRKEKGSAATQTSGTVDSPDPGPPRPSAADLETLGRASGIGADRRVFLFDGGEVRVVTKEQATQAGYRIVDLSDDHAPFIFSEETPGLSDHRPNEYRATYVNLANDRTDEEGRPLLPDQHNYVELFGIHPSLSVIQKRFLADEAKTCYSQIDIKLLSQFRGVIRYKGGKRSAEVLARYRELERRVHRAMRRTGRRTVGALAGSSAYRALVRAYRRAQVRVEVINQVQLRLRCEGLLGEGEHYRRRVFDYVTHRALSRFERKHMIFGWGQIYGKTRAYLGSPPLLNNYRALLRVLAERVADSLGIIEDGSVLGVKGIDASYREGGKKHQVPDLIGLFTKRLAKTLNLDDPAKALAFFKAQRPDLFKHFRVGLRLPALPPYYGDKMKFLVEIHRGDVWYDYPYDAAGKKRRQPRSRYPHLVLYTIWKDQKIPLVRWQTTIGGWRKEHKDGKVYLKYKNSDVGPRVWRDIVAAPVWIPPESTPPSALVTREKVDGKWVWRVKREEIGPSYLSAYGLVAAYHLQKIGEGRRALWRDNGIRTHGSVAYMSIFGGFSHGCHRLHNHLAVRLFSFILRHSSFRRRGQVPLRYGRTFSYKGHRYQIVLHTRGYYYTLNKPLSVFVTEGRVRGKVKEPIERYMPMPGEQYAPDDPNLQDVSGQQQGGWSGPDSLPPDVPPADAQPIHPASPDLPAPGAKLRKEPVRGTGNAGRAGAESQSASPVPGRPKALPRPRPGARPATPVASRKAGVRGRRQRTDSQPKRGISRVPRGGGMPSGHNGHGSRSAVRSTTARRGSKTATGTRRTAGQR